MKRLLPFVFSILAQSAFAFQTAVNSMPPEETKPTSYWWWIIGVILAIALGMLLYILIKRDPKRDAT
jgi:phosphotransferase system  glucose/maltose/N-acetylglucosamine-specific IIC component